MDGYKVGSKDGFAGRLEVIEGRTGRRRWSEVEKARIASESFRPGARVAEVARRHGTTRWQIYDWRKRLTRGMLTAPADDSLAFASVVIAPESPRSSPVQKKDAAPTDVVEVVVEGIVIRAGSAIEEAHRLPSLPRSVHGSRLNSRASPEPRRWPKTFATPWAYGLISSGSSTTAGSSWTPTQSRTKFGPSH